MEVLLVRCLDRAEAVATWSERWLVLARGLGGVARGTRIVFADDLSAVISSQGERGEVHLMFEGVGRGNVMSLIDARGHIPLPPYIEAARRKAHPGASMRDVTTAEDNERYQTVFARVPGAVAAPTAGLHFTHELLEEVLAAGHEIARIALHVGPGTFRPVEVDDPHAHVMDTERYDIPSEAHAAILNARAEGRPIVAVGTTVVRTLETLARTGWTQGPGETSLFLTPGDSFEVVTDLITNFHLPKSTLLMLVAAFAGTARVLDAYREAVSLGYRFYSYGDAMFIEGGS